MANLQISPEFIYYIVDNKVLSIGNTLGCVAAMLIAMAGYFLLARIDDAASESVKEYKEAKGTLNKTVKWSVVWAWSLVYVLAVTVTGSSTGFLVVTALLELISYK